MNSDAELKMEKQVVRVLLVEDDEDDYVIIRDLLEEITGWTFDLEWTDSYQNALEKTKKTEYDICLIDYRLGERDGLELLSHLRESGFETPIIILTGHGDQAIDFQAMKQGAYDYFEKGNLDSDHLWRSIRYAIEHSKILQELKKSESQLRLLSAKLLEAQENERKIIAQELHDSIGASLTAIRYGLEEKLHRMGKENTPPEGISLEQIISIVRDTIEETQRISSNLRPSILDDIGLLKTIEWLCRGFEKVYSGIRIEKAIELKEEDVREPLKIVIYRIAQEATTNAAKYSEADTIRISLSKTKAAIELAVEDNGKGFDVLPVLTHEDHIGRMGLRGMKERVELSNGVFEVTSVKSEGTIIRARWLV